MLSNTAVPIEYGKFREKVMRGEIPVCKEISMEMNRIDYLIDNPEYYYDDKAIEGFIKFAETEMTLTNGEPLKLLPSFRLWAECLLAWFYYSESKVYNPDTGEYEIRIIKKRLVNKQYLIVTRAAAKSLYASLIQAYGLVIDTETTHQIVTAPTMRQAEETMAPIRTALARSNGPLFKVLTQGSKLSNNAESKVKLGATKKGVENFMTNSLLEVRPMSINKLQGLRSKYNTVDEWLSGDIKEDPIGALEQGAAKQDNYIILATSSEGTKRDGVGDTIKMELLDKLKGNIFDPHTSIWYYRLDDISEVGKPEMWLKCNPNLGATVSYEVYHQEVKTAETNPAKRADILAKRFGIPVEGFTYFFTYEETVRHRKQNFDGLECIMGGDLSQGDDFCAFTFIFPLGHETFGIKTRAYVSESKVKKLPKAMREKYDEFVDEGTLVIVPGVILSMNKVYDDLQEFIDIHRYIPLGFGYDPYNAKDFVEKWCVDHGDFGVTKVIQGSKTESVPLGELKTLAENRRLIFDEELMKFAMGNSIAIEDNNGNRKLSKKRADEKIDNVAAMMDAWVAYRKIEEVFL